MFKIILKNAKNGLIYARAHVDATWHARPRGHARLPAWRGCDVDAYLYLLYIYIFIL